MAVCRASTASDSSLITSGHVIMMYDANEAVAFMRGHQTVDSKASPSQSVGHMVPQHTVPGTKRSRSGRHRVAHILCEEILD